MKFALVPWSLDFVDDVARYADNPAVARNLRDVFPNPYTREDAQGYIEACIAREGQGQLCRAIVLDGEAVGSVGVFAGDDVYRKSAELGYWLAEPFWCRGIMTEAVRRICADAFARFDVVRIHAEPYARNKGSRRVLEKAGFILEGTLKKSVYKNGELLDSCIYALLR